MADLIKILLTGGGAPGCSGIIKGLRERSDLHITSCDMQSEVVGKVLADDFFQVPGGDDPEYIDFLLQACVARDINVVIPITTRELLPLSRNKPRFSEVGIKIIVSPWTDLEIANHKCELYQHLEKAKVPVPQYFIAKTVSEFQLAAAQLNHPFTFKPCFGNGSRGFRIVDDQASRSKLLFDTKPGHSYITYDEAIDVLSEASFPPLLVSEFLPGDEYSVDCVLDANSIPRVIIPRKRIKINNGISAEGLIENNEEIIKYCKEILKTMRLTGPIGIQVKINKDNKPMILEINPRLQGSSSACMEAGVNVPLIALNLALQSTFIAPEIQWGTHFYRQYKDYS